MEPNKGLTRQSQGMHAVQKPHADEPAGHPVIIGRCLTALAESQQQSGEQERDKRPVELDGCMERNVPPCRQPLREGEATEDRQANAKSQDKDHGRC